MYYITPVFRYERPQAGRLREHHQFGVEFYGSNKPSADAEVMLVANQLLNSLGLQVKLNINSMGCPKCRAEYNKALKEYFKDKLENMCPTCQVRYEKNPLRLLDCKEEKCKQYTQNAPKITDYLCQECSEHFESVKNYLQLAGLEYTVNPLIVRGLDYYTKTVFEFVTVALGTQGTVCGGGRYDGLVEQIGGNSTPCVGFGMGIERVLMLIEATGAQIPSEKQVDLYFATYGEPAYQKAFALAMQLRKQGLKVELDHLGRSIKAQFKYADKIKARYCIVVGDNEIASKEVVVKDMKNSQQKTVKLENLLKELV